MFFRINKNIEKINSILEDRNIQEFIYVLGNKREIFKRNLLAGISKGVGIGIGFTMITSLIIMLLKEIVTLNIPIIGKYIAEIVNIVENYR